jgi:hypothetical protein
MDNSWQVNRPPFSVNIPLARRDEPRQDHRQLDYDQSLAELAFYEGVPLEAHRMQELWKASKQQTAEDCGGGVSLSGNHLKPTTLEIRFSANFVTFRLDVFGTLLVSSRCIPRVPL